MKDNELIHCPHCGGSDLQKNGHSENNTQRWHCKDCSKNFQQTYRYNARKKGGKEQIGILTLNSAGVRDISRILQINKNTVVSELKKTTNVNPYVLDKIEKEQLKRLEIEIFYTAELDEFWSFVGNKKNQRWTWYAMDKASGIILACHNGGRSDADFLRLQSYLARIPIDFYFSDNWGSYSKYLPADKHYIGKERTWKIERKNLNFRTHIKRLNRKTICYSKNDKYMIMSLACILNDIILRQENSNIPLNQRHDPKKVYLRRRLLRILHLQIIFINPILHGKHIPTGKIPVFANKMEIIWIC
jgi:insertion element IS1 protein InsB